MEEIRLKEKEVKLNNQHIIEIGYMARKLISIYAATREKLYFEEANCYSSIFYLLKKYLLKMVDPEYLETHKEVRDFYNQDLSNDWDRLVLSEDTFTGEKAQKDGQEIWQALHDAGYKDVDIQKYADHYKVEIPCQTPFKGETGNNSLEDTPF